MRDPRPPSPRATSPQLNVLVRLRGDADAPLAQPQQLQAYLQERCPGLLEQLRAGWATDWGQAQARDIESGDWRTLPPPPAPGRGNTAA